MTILTREAILDAELTEAERRVRHWRKPIKEAIKTSPDPQTLAELDACLSLIETGLDPKKALKLKKTTRPKAAHECAISTVSAPG